MLSLSTPQLVDELKIFVTYQEQLLAYVWSHHKKQPQKQYELYNIPKSGLFSLKDRDWKWRRHGAGIRFEECESGLVVDPHKHVETHPKIFDAWRVSLFLESKGLLEILVGNEVFSTDDERSVKSALEALRKNGTICESEAGNQHYRFCV